MRALRMKYSSQEKELLSEVFKLIAEYRERVSATDAPVTEFTLPLELRAASNLTLPVQGTGGEGLLANIRTYLNKAVNTHSPRFANQLFGGYELPAFLGEVITALTNTSMYTYEVAPLATLMELEIIQKMASYANWNNAEGALLTGGSNTNLVAMLLARNRKFPQAKRSGIAGLPTMHVYVSARSHYSLRKAANTLGIGSEQVIPIDVDEQGALLPLALEQAINHSKEVGAVPFMVVLTAGTTETGSFDPIVPCAAIARREKIWLHVDGSWGGSLLLSKRNKELFEGLELCDSFSWNPHKLMSIPLVCAALIVKEKGTLLRELGSRHADYIFHENETSSFDLGPASLQCGKRNDALKLWLAWQYFGDDGYAERINYLLDLAKEATALIEADPELELMFATQTLNVNFRVLAPGLSASELDRFNEQVRQMVVKSGKAMVNYCHLPKGLSIRLVLLNPDMTLQDIQFILETFKSCARELLAEIQPVKA